MKTLINEVLRFQKIAGITLNEEMESEPLKVSLIYNDYPSISNSYHKKVSSGFMKLVNNLGGKATPTKAVVDEVDFEITGISSFEKLKAVYDKEALDTYLESWKLNNVIS